MKFPIFAAALVCIPSAFADSLHLKTGAITVDDKGTKLAYTDTGAPSLNPYTTVFAVHGMGFNAGIFEKVQATARSSLRFVSVTRRGYIGSTAFSDDEIRVLNNGTDSEKTAFHAARGLELLEFMDNFIQQEHISFTPKSPNGGSGGIALLGWSMGNTLTLSAIANIKSAPAATRARLGPNLRTLILHEPSTNLLGLPVDDRNWVPWTIINPAIPEDSELSLFAEWVSGYFQHGDLSTRSHDVLTYLSHSFNLRPPSVYNMAAVGRGSIVENTESVKLDIPYQINFVPQLQAAYQTIFSKDTYIAFPNMKNFFFGAEHTASYGPITTWAVQDDDKAHGGGFIRAKLISGVNHMVAWDDPAVALRTYNDCINRKF